MKNKETLEEVCHKVLNYLYPNLKKQMTDLQYYNAIDSLKSIAKFQEQQTIEEVLAFGKSCFYKGFEKAEKDDANCYTAFREEIGSLIEQFKKK